MPNAALLGSASNAILPRLIREGAQEREGPQDVGALQRVRQAGEVWEGFKQFRVCLLPQGGHQAHPGVLRAHLQQPVRQ